MIHLNTNYIGIVIAVRVHVSHKNSSILYPLLRIEDNIIQSELLN